jgi:hypothetical protein
MSADVIWGKKYESGKEKGEIGRKMGERGKIRA